MQENWSKLNEIEGKRGILIMTNRQAWVEFFEHVCEKLIENGVGIRTDYDKLIIKELCKLMIEDSSNWRIHGRAFRQLFNVDEQGRSLAAHAVFTDDEWESNAVKVINIAGENTNINTLAETLCTDCNLVINTISQSFAELEDEVINQKVE